MIDRTNLFQWKDCVSLTRRIYVLLLVSFLNVSNRERELLFYHQTVQTRRAEVGAPPVDDEAFTGDKFLFPSPSLTYFSAALLQGDSLRTNIQLDFGDGTAVSYSNLSWTEEGIKHVYRSAGIFRVTALAENTLGYDSVTLYLHITCKSSWFQLKSYL